MSERTLSVRWDDPAALAAAGRALSGIEFLRAIRDRRLPAPPMAQLLGFDLVEVEPGHAVLLRTLRLQPLLDLELRLGEGTGAVLAMSLVEAALRILREMATFTTAGVTDAGV